MLKIFSISDDGANFTLNEDSLQDMETESFTICSNQVDTIAFGGPDKKAYIQKIALKDDEEALECEEPTLAMAFDTPVSKLEFVNGGANLVGIAEDAFVQIMDVESSKVVSSLKGLHECSVKNASVDPHFEYLATTGCDGSLHITSIKDLANMEKAKNLSISKKQVTPESPQLLEMAWSADGGDYLYVAGDTQLTIINRKDGFSQSFASAVTHTKEISIVKVLSPICMVTVGLDK